MRRDTEHSGVLVFADSPDRLARLASTGRGLVRMLGAPLAAVVLDGDCPEDPAVLFDNGYEEVIRVHCEPRDSFGPERYTHVLMALVKERAPLAILFDASKTGTEVCARVSSRLGLPAATGCRAVRVEDATLVVERLAYGGRFTAVQKFEKPPFLLSVIPKDIPHPVGGRSGGVVTEATVQFAGSSVKVEGEELGRTGGGLDRAERIVAVGRGLRRKEDLEMITSLASVLSAEIAATRPLTEDLRWLPPQVQVGISGKTVKPKLYVACGVSGQIQHIAGMRESQIVVAINTDKDAPIFQEADYAIVGDMYQVLPALTQALAQRTSIGQSI